MPNTLDGLNRDKTYMRKQGSAFLALTEVQQTGAALAVADTIHDMGYAQKTVYDRKTEETKEADQGGTEHVSGDKTTATFDYTIMQRDEKHLKLPLPASNGGFAGKYGRFYVELTNKKLGTGANKGQILVIGCATIEPSLNIDGSDMYVKHKWNPTPVTVAVTVDLSAFTGSLGAGVGSATFAPGDYEQIVEFTYA
jgi:hypothetical protein